jgi:hypothetical protein
MSQKSSVLQPAKSVSQALTPDTSACPEGAHARKPAEALPPPSPRKYWTRRGIALPNRDFWEAIRVPISANILI